VFVFRQDESGQGHAIFVLDEEWLGIGFAHRRCDNGDDGGFGRTRGFQLAQGHGLAGHRADLAQVVFDHALANQGEVGHTGRGDDAVTALAQPRGGLRFFLLCHVGQHDRLAGAGGRGRGVGGEEIGRFHVRRLS
jgi:hypothetical protein